MKTTTRHRIATWSIAGSLVVALLVVGASLYEHLVIDPVWPDNPSVIRPDEGGIDRKDVWIPLHAAIMVLLPLALWAGWRTPARRALVGAALGYVVYRGWSIVYFIPNALRYEEPGASLDGAGTWIALSTLRLPIMVACAVLLLLATRRAGSGVIDSRAPHPSVHDRAASSTVA